MNTEGKFPIFLALAAVAVYFVVSWLVRLGARVM